MMDFHKRHEVNLPSLNFGHFYPGKMGSLTKTFETPRAITRQISGENSIFKPKPIFQSPDNRKNLDMTPQKSLPKEEKKGRKKKVKDDKETRWSKGTFGVWSGGCTDKEDLVCTV
jgi:hypothetical protein